MREGFLGGVAAVVVTAAVWVGANGDPSVPTAAATERAANCPAKLLPLGANPIAAASRAALRAERPADRPQVRSASVAALGSGRSGQVAHNCGSRVAARSVVVEIRRRAYDSGPNQSASLSQGIVVVGRFRSGWRVWDILH